MFNNARVPKVRKGAKKALTPVKELGSESSSEADDESDDVPKKKKARKSSAPTKEKKVMHHQPMTPFFEKKLRDVVHGKKTPSNPKGRKGYSIEPAGQLPDSNNLGKLFNRKPKDVSLALPQRYGKTIVPLM
ncbi:hypothetical protein PQX77_021482 [Marasmius sp. AFHP31]|nr:hypothetical protein PQX77_021482 [Marasmius sp. AFHP31]